MFSNLFDKELEFSRSLSSMMIWLADMEDSSWRARHCSVLRISRLWQPYSFFSTMGRDSARLTLNKRFVKDLRSNLIGERKPPPPTVYCLYSHRRSSPVVKGLAVQTKEQYKDIWNCCTPDWRWWRKIFFSFKSNWPYIGVVIAARCNINILLSTCSLL